MGCLSVVVCCVLFGVLVLLVFLGVLVFVCGAFVVDCWLLNVCSMLFIVACWVLFVDCCLLCVALY